MLKGIWSELVLIRKELQAIRNNLESNSETAFQKKPVSQVIRENGITKRVRPTH